MQKVIWLLVLNQFMHRTSINLKSSVWTCPYAETGEFQKCKYRKLPTNGDRIRSMTNEELARFISGKARGFGEEYEGYMSALDWLQEPIEDELI